MPQPASSRKGVLDRVLSVAAEVRPGEGATAVLLAVNVFVLLSAYYTIRPLRSALLLRRQSLLRTFTKNLMAYGLGRRLEYFDMPAIRTIVNGAEKKENRFSAYVLGVVNSQAFQMQKVEE